MVLTPGCREQSGEWGDRVLVFNGFSFNVGRRAVLEVDGGDGCLAVPGGVSFAVHPSVSPG